mmetsp:Transcript_3220/g.11237  ORF Transcript_3220/g.11237 Transcript_3220/m.11237 type:complete len:313 (+) Transcript_3220:26-964(+)
MPSPRGEGVCTRQRSRLPPRLSVLSPSLLSLSLSLSLFLLSPRITLPLSLPLALSTLSPSDIHHFGDGRCSRKEFVVVCGAEEVGPVVVVHVHVHVAHVVSAALVLHGGVSGGVLADVLLHALLVLLWLAEEEGCRLSVQRIGGVGVEQQLRQEGLEHVHQLEHGAPRLVDHIQAYRARPLVHVGVEDLVHESDGWRLVRIGLGEVHAQLPCAALVGAVLGPVEDDGELAAHVSLHVHFIVAHHELHDVHLAPAVWRRHGFSLTLCSASRTPFFFSNDAKLSIPRPRFPLLPPLFASLSLLCLRCLPALRIV